MSPAGIPTVTVEDVVEGTALLDVREDEEWAAGHIASARHIPMSRFIATLNESPQLLTPDEPLVVVCAVGARSAQVTGWLNQHGYDAANLAGGMHAWADAGRPMSSDTGRPAIVL